jgi:hypothetical protein
MRRGVIPACLTTVCAVALTACTADVDTAAPATTTTPRPTTVAPTTVAPTTVAPTTTTVAPTTTGLATATVPPQERLIELCGSPTSFLLGQVEHPELDEASGLVASRRHRDVIWAHNDGGEDTGLFALGLDGADLGFHRVLLDDAVDIEDIAMVSGPDGDDVLLADIGDNGTSRTSIRLFRFAEPEPWAIEPITDVEVLEFEYPDRPHNAEVLLVDEANDRLVIVTKEQRQTDGIPPDLAPTAPSFVFEGPLDGHSGEPVALTAAGMLDAPLLETRTVAATPHPASLLGIGGLPTGGDVSADGAIIALRTYETIWVWARPLGRSVAESLADEPCQAQIAPEPQGEAVAVRGDSLITVSEGVNPNLFELRP